MWSDNVCGDLNDLCKRGFLTKTNQDMCDCVLCFSLIEKQSDRNLVRGRGKFNVYEEIISLQFTVYDTSHRICEQCMRKLQKRRGLLTRQAFRRKPAKETKNYLYLAVTNRGQENLNTLQLHLNTSTEA